MKDDLLEVIEELEAVLAGMQSAARRPEGKGFAPLAECLAHNIDQLRELGGD